MTRRLKTTVLEGGRIEIELPELDPGQVVDVLIEANGGGRKLTAFENLQRYPAQPIFRTPEEVDRFIQSERDSWDR